MYRVGLPFWKWFARRGVPLSLRVIVHYDNDTKSFWTSSPDLNGLVVTGANPDEIRAEVKHAIPQLLELELNASPPVASPKFKIEPAPA